MTLFYEDTFENSLSTGYSWIYEVKDNYIFHFKIGSNLIEYEIIKELSIKDFKYWVLAILIPLKLTLEKRYNILYASAVNVGDGAVLFTGETYTGKSTMSAYFSRQGHAFFGDDLIPMYQKINKYYATFSYPYCRTIREDERLGNKIKNVSTRAKPIKAIFLLEQNSLDDAISVVKLDENERDEALYFDLNNNFVELKEYQDKIKNNILESIPIYKVVYPWGREHLAKVRETILAVLKP